MLVFLWLTAGSLGGCVSAPQPPEVPVAGNAVIYVVGRGWHTDIALPVDEVPGRWRTWNVISLASASWCSDLASATT